MTLKTKINLSFETSLNNRFSLYSSSTDRNPTPSNRASAGACLAKVAARLDKNHSSLFEQARTIEATLTPIFKEQAVFYLMELKIDGRALLAGNNQPLQIKLNERFVKTLAGGSFSPYSTVYRNPFPLAVAHKVYTHTAPELDEFLTKKQKPIQARSKWEILKETTAFYAYQLRCGLNTGFKILLSFLPNTGVDAPNGRWGSQFTSPILWSCLQFIIKKFEKSVEAVPVGAFFEIPMLSKAKQDKQFLVFPLVVEGTFGNHITLLLAEKNKDGTWNIEFYDGKAIPIDDPKNVKAHLLYQQFDPQSIKSFKQLTTPLQFDGHNCGAFVCWFAEQRLQGRSFEQIAASSVDIESYRADLLMKTDKAQIISQLSAEQYDGPDVLTFD